MLKMFGEAIGLEASTCRIQPLMLGLKYSNKASNVLPDQKVSGAIIGIFIQVVNKLPFLLFSAARYRLVKEALWWIA